MSTHTGPCLLYLTITSYLIKCVNDHRSYVNISRLFALDFYCMIADEDAVRIS